MTTIDQLALEAAKALKLDYDVGLRFPALGSEGFRDATDEELADLLAPFLRRAAEVKEPPPPNSQP